MSLLEARPDTAVCPGGLKYLASASEGHVEGCLEAEELLALAAGRFFRRTWRNLDEHLDSCDACLRLAASALHALYPERGSIADLLGPPRNVGSGALLANRYQIETFLSRGGMGEVYRARDRVLNEVVAIKAVLATACDSARAVGRLLEEAVLARRVQHPNVCRTRHVDVDERLGQPAVHFIAMDFIPGCTLREHLRLGPMPLNDVVAIARQLLDGLSAIHDAGVLHLDLKPDNIILTSNDGSRPRVTIIDFGLALPLDVNANRAQMSRMPCAGSLGYVAPEQLAGLPMGPVTDLYSFGVVCLDMLTGASRSLASLKGRTKALADISRRDPSAARRSAAFQQIIRRCLQRDARSRHPSARAVSSDLERF